MSIDWNSVLFEIKNGSWESVKFMISRTAIGAINVWLAPVVCISPLLLGLVHLVKYMYQRRDHKAIAFHY